MCEELSENVSRVLAHLFLWERDCPLQGERGSLRSMEEKRGANCYLSKPQSQGDLGSRPAPTLQTAAGL